MPATLSSQQKLKSEPELHHCVVTCAAVMGNSVLTVHPTAFDRLRKELESLKVSNKELEQMARKRKGKGEQDVEAWLTEFDKEMGTKDKAFKDEMAVYQDVVARLKDCTAKTEDLKKEREAYEKSERERKIRELTDLNQKKRLDKAAGHIQATWKEFWVRHCIFSTRTQCLLDVRPSPLHSSLWWRNLGHR